MTSIEGKILYHCQLNITDKVSDSSLAGLLAFVANALAGVWIKYSPHSSVSIAATACMGLAFVYLMHLYFRWTPYYTGRTRPSRNAAIRVSIHLSSHNLLMTSFPRHSLPCRFIMSLSLSLSLKANTATWDQASNARLPCYGHTDSGLADSNSSSA